MGKKDKKEEKGKMKNALIVLLGLSGKKHNTHTLVLALVAGALTACSCS